VAEHVRQRYKKDKVILLGHSWGTIVGMQAALKRPDLFHAYVGVGQVINVRDNERISYDYAVRVAKEKGNQEALTELASIAPYPGDQPITRERIITARKWPQYYGGLTAYRDSSLYYYDAPLLRPSMTRPMRKPSMKATCTPWAKSCRSSWRWISRVCANSRSRSSCSWVATITRRRPCRPWTGWEKCKRRTSAP
jgi:pimeloyl-ACP methyl ester carboxylesterase